MARRKKKKNDTLPEGEKLKGNSAGRLPVRPGHPPPGDNLVGTEGAVVLLMLGGGGQDGLLQAFILL